MVDDRCFSAPTRPVCAIGLMSGTSLDGIDAAVLTTDGEAVVAPGPALSIAYAEEFRTRLRGLLGRRPGPEAAPLIGELTELHARAVEALLATAGIAGGAVDVVGFHGQTVWHRPAAGETIQVGDGGWLADRLGIPVVFDFRTADVMAGGQGAPLVPLFHGAITAALPKPVAVLNLGGVANVSWIGAGGDGDGLLAFDTGPANALIDDWVLAHTGRAYDAAGRLAAAGRIDHGLVARWLRHPYFAQRPPKSLDRDTFGGVLAELAGRAPADGAATLTAFSAGAVGASLAFLPEAPRRWLVCGGGRHNPVLLSNIADAVAAAVAPIEAIGYAGDFIEAQAFAYLAVRALRKLPLTLPSTTGVPRPQRGGRLFLPAATERR